MIGAGIVPRALGEDFEPPARGHRHRFAEHATELEDFPGSNQPRRTKHRLRLHVIAGPSLIALAPFRRATLAVCRRLPGLCSGLAADTDEQASRDHGSEQHNDLQTDASLLMGSDEREIVDFPPLSVTLWA